MKGMDPEFRWIGLAAVLTVLSLDLMLTLSRWFALTAIPIVALIGWRLRKLDRW